MNQDRVSQFVAIMQRMHKNNLNFKHKMGMPHGEFTMMQTIRHHDKGEGVTISELSEYSQITKPAVSQIINVIEEKGFVERVTTKQDRRVVRVRMTEAGEAAVKASCAIASRKLDKVLEKMGHEDADAFLKLLDKFSMAVSSYSESEDDVENEDDDKEVEGK